MPLPALAIVPLISSVAASIAGMFAAWMTKKVALIVAVMSLSTLLFVGFAAAIIALYQGIVYVTPPWMMAGIGMFIPPNTVPMLSLLMTARLARLAYDFQREKLRLACNLGT